MLGFKFKKLFDDSTYTLRMWCWNCKNFTDMEIPKGKSVNRSERFMCPNCGCETMEKS
jgi:hypothetical protein